MSDFDSTHMITDCFGLHSVLSPFQITNEQCTNLLSVNTLPVMSCSPKKMANTTRSIQTVGKRVLSSTKSRNQSAFISRSNGYRWPQILVNLYWYLDDSTTSLRYFSNNFLQVFTDKSNGHFRCPFCRSWVAGTQSISNTDTSGNAYSKRNLHM